MGAGNTGQQIGDNDVAVVGMAAHLPGAADIVAFWENLKAGVCSIRRLTEADLLANGEAPERIARPNYVPHAAGLDGYADFDAAFFGFSPKEAAILDPQHRHFLEVAWEALENAGHPPEAFAGRIGVYAGCGMGSYFYLCLCSNPDLVDETGLFLLRHTGNDKDFLPTRVSHVLDLKGPSVAVQTACSTSLVAVHLAAQALISGECDMALAGGVTIELPQGRGYLVNAGEILSPDGQCHAFDHRAQGTVFGSGAGCVVLRRAKDALRDGDHIWAILKGSAINNDGAAKASYLAPSVQGQADCVAEALARSGTTADRIGYVECHGTGTYLGDPIEIAALTSAFRRSSGAVGTCRIGSVKTNIGHLDTAAGVAGLIKAALSLHHRQIPPSLGYEAANPAIDFATSPFQVNDRLNDWQDTAPRVAAVNALGVGGTNAHAVLQEAPPRQSEQSLWPFQPLVLSARTPAALDEMSARLAAHLHANPDQPLADAAFTLKEGRRAFARRRVVVARSPAEAAELLATGDSLRVFTHEVVGDAPEVVFLFPGGGAQYVGMARGLYATEPLFADWMDRGLAELLKRTGEDYRDFWLPQPGHEAAAEAELLRPSRQLPLLMIVEYALAQMYLGWGVKPGLLLGHSMGENTAACLAGVIGFEDCIGLVLLRGQLFETLPGGGMLSVPMAEAELRPLLGSALDLAAVNAPGLSVVSGPVEALETLERRLAAAGVEYRRIAIEVAAHSRMLEPILALFRDYLGSVRLRPPGLPMLSNRSGRLLTPEEAVSPDYWVQQLRGTVEFGACMDWVRAVPGRVLMELGPGRALTTLAQANAVAAGHLLPALRHPDHDIADDVWHMTSLARLWACGVAVDWDQVWAGARRLRVPLPGYAFQRQRHFIEPGRAAAAEPAPQRIDDVAGWGWRPDWRPVETGFDLAADLDAAPARRWLIFLDDVGLGAAASDRLRRAGHAVCTVRSGDGFGRDGDLGYVLAPERGREGYDLLLADLAARGMFPERIGHFWLVTGHERFRPGSSFFHRNVEHGFCSLFHLGQALAAEGLPAPLHLTIFTNGAEAVAGEALPYPEKALVAGPVRVMPQEIAGITASSLDICLPESRRAPLPEPLIARVLEEMLSEPQAGMAALRGTRRYLAGVKPQALPAELDDGLPEGAHVFITGGFGGIGLGLAEDLILRRRARITLVARQALPGRALWDRYLASHDAGASVSRRIAAVKRLEMLGGRICVVAADVCNVEDMRAARAEAEARFGPVNLLIHAAGVVADAPLAAKTEAQVETVLAAKLHGTRVLDQVFPDGSVDQMVLFASTSTVIAPAGQIDYVAANAYLNAFAKARAGGKTQVLALNWGIWAEVGMAVEAHAAQGKGGSAGPIAAALLSTAGRDRAGPGWFGARLASDDWVLDGHRTRSGQALLPGTGVVEIAAESWRAQGGAGGCEIRDLVLFRPLAVAEVESRQIRATLRSDGAGFGFELSAEAMAAGRRGWEIVAEASMQPLPGRAAPLDVLAVAARLPAAETGSGLPSPQEAQLCFGERWRVLASRAFGSEEGLARLRLPAAFVAEAGPWVLHPALLDVATGWAMTLVADYAPDRLWVPLRYGRIAVWRDLPAEIVSWVRLVGADAGEARFDITLARPDGEVCVEIEGFVMHRLDQDLVLSPAGLRDLRFDDEDATAAAQPVARALSLGIRVREGQIAFRRALALRGGAVYVSSIDLPALIRQGARPMVQRRVAPGEDAVPAAAHGQAPQTEAERQVAAIWQELLGVGRIGTADNFFDLGGHSLLAVRLFARLRRVFGVDLPISTLLTAPTVAALAARVAPVGSAQAAGPSAQAAAQRFTHLVQMHPGRGRPFFLVAGMFGNVLNLRHLASLLDADRPFYGLQARGLFGEAAPHRSFAEAATDYIVEMRLVQPKGPYQLGGFSGGGLIAWEIAHQLEQAGEVVSVLALLDTPLPRRPMLGRLDKAIIKLAELRDGGFGFLRRWAKARWAWERQKFQAAPVDTDPAAFHNRAIEAAFRASAAAYDLPLRQGPATLFRPPLDRRWRVSAGNWVSQAREYVFADNDLTRFAPMLQVIEVPGDHDSMVLEPNVRVLAARLREVVAKAEGASNVVALATAAE